MNANADLNQAFIGGDSARGNITQTLVSWVGSIGLTLVKVKGRSWCTRILEVRWVYMCTDNKGLDDPRMRLVVGDLKRLGCEKVLIFVVEKDH